MRFTEFAAVTEPRHTGRIVRITVRPVVQDCAGTVYITDIKAQEGCRRTGYTEANADKLLPADTPPRFHNGIVRGGMTVIIPNTGGTSAGLDCRIYPKHGMAAGAVSLAQGEGANSVTFLDDAAAGDELALLASTRRCLKNGEPSPKDGFFQYTAAHDSKHIVTIPTGTSARVYFEYREMTEANTD